jgi:hypothetical protein
VNSLKIFGRLTLALILITTIISCQSTPPRQDAASTAAQSVTTGSAAAMPVTPQLSGGGFGVYGNWCGPNHPLDELMDVAPGPTDPLDAACMIHDYCYAEKGYLDCECDENLIDNLKRQLAFNDFSTEQILVARGIRNYFAASPCKQSSQNPQAKTAANRSMYRAYNGVKRRMTYIWDWTANRVFEEDTIKTHGASRGAGSGPEGER